MKKRKPQDAVVSNIKRLRAESRQTAQDHRQYLKELFIRVQLLEKAFAEYALIKNTSKR